MASNNTTRVLMATDPNNNGFVNTEDLCIIVDLETETKSRSNFVTRKGVGYLVTDKSDSSKIKFLEGTKQNGVNSLTTNYTNIGNYKNATTILNTQGEDFEGLGMSSIDISFNSSFAPLIVINFIDVRGWSILEQGNDSKYKVFFSMPYPIFKLTIKGYFGQAVTYSLHLTKWNAKFNAKTGNFEIKCEFIGHTYAFLTDMLIGYLKACVETPQGKQLLAQKQLINPDIISITELITRISKFDQSLVKIKQDSPVIKGLSAVDNKLTKLTELKETISKFTTDLIGTNFNISGYDGLYGMIDTTVKVNNLPTLSTYIKPVSSKSDIVNQINTFSSENGELGSMVTEINNNLDSGLVLSTDKFKKILLFNGTLENFRINNTLRNNFDTFKYDFIISGFDDMVGTVNIVVFDFSIVLKDISSKIEALNVVKDGLMVDASSELKNRVSSDVNIRTDIKTIFGILCAHVEIFIELIRQVADKTKDNQSRINKFKKYLGDLDVNQETSSNVNGSALKTVIYPFPGYNNDGIETWIGKIVDNIPETDFINSLFDGFLKSTEAENILESNLYGNILNWYPVNILDTKFFTDEHPYGKIKDTPNYLVILDKIIKRAFVNLHYSNTHIKDSELKAFSKIEGLTIVDNLTCVTGLKILTQKTIDELLTEYNNYTDNAFTLTNNTDSTAETSKSYFLTDKITLAGGNTGRYLPTNTLDDSSDYIKILSETEYEEGLYGEYPSYDISDTNYTTSDNPLALYNVANDELYLNSTSNQGNYDFMSGKYKIQEFFKVATDTSSKIRYSDEIFWSNYASSSDIMYNIFGYKNGNENTTSIINKLTNNVDFINKTQIGFQSLKKFSSVIYKVPTIYSLFGSEFYFRQLDNINVNHKAYPTNEDRLIVANRAKAILFLHTLPLDGLVGISEYGLFSEFDNSKIASGFYTKGGLKRGLFNKRGGFVKVPKAWVLLVGGLLWRYNSVINGDLSKDPIIFYNESNGTTNFFVDGLSNTGNIPTVDQYLKSVVDANYFHEPMKFSDYDSYVQIEDVLLELPRQVKIAFINYFTDWTDGRSVFSDIINWNDIRETYELEDISSVINSSTYQTLITSRDTIWSEISTATGTNSYSLKYNDQTEFETHIETKISNTDVVKNILKTKSIYKTDVLNRCKYITGNFNNGNNTDNQDKPIRSNYNISYIDTVNDTGSINDCLTSIIEPVVMANSTWRIWATEEDVYKYTGYYTNSFNVNENTLREYLSNVIRTINSKIGGENLKTKEENNKQQAFGILDNDTIKLNLYRTVKAIYDKWVAGTESGALGITNDKTGETVELIDTFRFLNKGYEDIGEQFLINPLTIKNEIKNNMNQSFYDLISRILVSNNFDFIPLPTYVDYKQEAELKKIFEPKTFKDYVNSTNVGPAFICMYVGQSSKHLNISDSHVDDAINFTTDKTKLPKVFSGDGYAVPVFSVNYAQGNQSFFKDIKLDQSEFSETDESLKIIDSIALQGDKMNRTPVGQNLFNVYSTRSYQAEIECMGNAMIQPMMYFQLNNIPMFRGGYLITRVNHTITPNSMMTTFRGVRVSNIVTPLIEEGDLYMNLLGSYSDVDSSSIKIEKSNIAWVTEARNVESDVLKSLEVFRLPLDSMTITSTFGSRNGKHMGIDLRTSVGDPIYALESGVLELIRLSPIKNGTSFGLYAIVRYNVNGTNWRSLYAHLDSIDSTILNDTLNVTSLDDLTDSQKNTLTSSGIALNKLVDKGTILGTTGGNPRTKNKVNGVSYAGKSSGPHLHFEIREEKSTNTATDITSIYFNNSIKRDPAQILGLVDYSTETNIGEPKES